MDSQPVLTDLSMVIETGWSDDGSPGAVRTAELLVAWLVVVADRFDDGEVRAVISGPSSDPIVVNDASIRTTADAWIDVLGAVLSPVASVSAGPVSAADSSGRWTLELVADGRRVCCRLRSHDARLAGTYADTAMDQLRSVVTFWSEGGAVSRDGAPRLGSCERALIVDRLGRTARTVDLSVGVHDQVAAFARTDPDAIAVVDDERSITYGELLARADTVARWLVDQGLEREDRVGILCGRSIESVVGALGVLRSGGAFVPLDPDYPEERTEFMLRDCHARCLVTNDGAAVVGSWRGPILVMTELESAVGGPIQLCPAEASDLAYVVYTSGSTGTPKGVMVEHGSLCNMVAWHRREFGVRIGTRGALAASPAFDPTVQDLWPLLTAGGSLHVLDEETRFHPQRLARWLAERHIEQIILPTPLGEAVLDQPELAASSLRYLFVGGDRLRARPAPDVPFDLVNLYGPAETTVMATYHHVRADGVETGIPAIGRPIDNTFPAVVDPDTLDLVAHGNVGELLIGGTGLARGYIGRPDLTAERFVTLNLDGQPARFYRTGDMVRWSEDSNLEFVGRTDHQVKVRGVRVEAGEVEAHLRRHPAILDAVVSAVDGAFGSELGAVVVPRDVTAVPPMRELRRFLLDSLPRQMVPTRISVADRLPITENGKVDRLRLFDQQTAGVR